MKFKFIFKLNAVLNVKKLKELNYLFFLRKCIPIWMKIYKNLKTLVLPVEIAAILN